MKNDREFLDEMWRMVDAQSAEQVQKAAAFRADRAITRQRIFSFLVLSTALVLLQSIAAWQAQAVLVFSALPMALAFFLEYNGTASILSRKDVSLENKH